MAEVPGACAGGGPCRTMQVRLDADLYAWLRAKSFVERRSMNTLIVEALARTRAIEAPHELGHDHYLGR